MADLVHFIIGRDQKKSGGTYADHVTAENFSSAFKAKVDMVRSSTASSPYPDFDGPGCVTRMDNFEDINTKFASRLLTQTANKSCALDPAPTWIVKRFVDELAPFVAAYVNVSIKTGSFPSNSKRAIITPVLKNPKLDRDDLNNYRPVSNLAFLSKNSNVVHTRSYTNIWMTADFYLRNNLHTEYITPRKPLSLMCCRMCMRRQTRVKSRYLACWIYWYIRMSARRGHPILLLGVQIASRRSWVRGLRIAWNSTLRKQRSSGWDLLDSFSVARWLLCSSPEHGLLHYRESATWLASVSSTSDYEWCAEHWTSMLLMPSFAP